MAQQTPIDAAFRAMAAAPDDPAPRLRFHERVMDAELFVLLEAEAEGRTLRPRVFDLAEGRFVLAFDRDDRLAAFLEAPAPYAALAGRRLAALLAGRGIGIVLNPEVATSQTMLAAEAVDWLARGAAGDEVTSARVREVGPPTGAPPRLIAAIEVKLAAMAGMVGAAWLGALRFDDADPRLALAIEGAPEAAEAAIAEAIAEAVRFAGLEDAGLDVTFVAAGTPARAAFARLGLRIDPPRPPAPPTSPPLAPGGDPDRPPRLR